MFIWNMNSALGPPLAGRAQVKKMIDTAKASGVI
jgi:hypothetical protein